MTYPIKKGPRQFSRPRALFFPEKVDTRKATRSLVSQRVLNQ
ncbi:hypothetical protein C4J83_0282 [Pseudomonas sp. LBUM920]|nr:hypothetical protein C4J83_0282 [Pseudomonas sp. LBUM920]